MNKREAIQEAHERGFAEINNGNSVFANVNASKPVWWMDIPVQKAMQGRYLLLFDGRIPPGILRVMHVPAAFFQDNCNSLYRENVKGVDKFRIELLADTPQMFGDVRPGGGGVNFGACLVNDGE